MSSAVSVSVVGPVVGLAMNISASQAVRDQVGVGAEHPGVGALGGAGGTGRVGEELATHGDGRPALPGGGDEGVDGLAGHTGLDEHGRHAALGDDAGDALDVGGGGLGGGGDALDALDVEAVAAPEV